jgi:hypothetical protein
MRRQICSMILVGSICGAVQSVYAQGQFVEPEGSLFYSETHGRRLDG